MIYYLAASYSRRAEIKAYADQIEALGFDVSSRWLIGEHEAKDKIATPREWWAWAKDDLADIDLADALIAFTEPQGNAGRGGRHFEWGYAVAKGKKLITVGPCESMFYTLATENYRTWERCYDELAAPRRPSR